MKRVYVYGGAFDPVTAGHTAIIIELLNLLKKEPESSLYILVSDNDTKEYSADCEDRMAMIVNTVNSLHSLYSDTTDVPSAVNDGEPSEIFRRVHIHDEVARTADALKDLMGNRAFENAQINLVLGFDEWFSLYKKQWKDSDWLLENVNFVVVPRDGYSKIGLEMDNVQFVNWFVPQTSSSQARKIMQDCPQSYTLRIPPVVMEYIRRNRLYGQVPTEEYNAIERSELEKYNPFQYPRPSVTVTSVMIRFGEVLLVKRRDFPYHDWWCLPGGFSNPKETYKAVGVREVKEETCVDIDQSKIKLVGVYQPKDPRFDVDKDAWGYDIGIMVELGQGCAPRAADDAKEVKWVSIQEALNMPLAFHHNNLLCDAINIYRKEQ